jgi:hypothetical protein
VLTGGPDRVERGLALLAAREDARLLISGVGHTVVPADLGATGERITLGHTATSTRGNAREVAAWARGLDLRSPAPGVAGPGGTVGTGMAPLGAGVGGATLAAAESPRELPPEVIRITVVTAGFHMPRALLELRRALPGARLAAHPVAPHRPRAGVLLREYAKLVGAALGLSALLDRPRLATAPTPSVPALSVPAPTAQEPRP